MTSKSGIVKLNIGGTIFHTTESTLTRFDGFFRTILETDVPVTKDDSGAFFIDRSPKHFDLILNFMRDGAKLPACKNNVEEISKEAQYYLLFGLVELCSKHTQVEPNAGIVKILYSDFEELASVVNSEKPVVVISLRVCSDFLNKNAPNDWKQFVARHSLKWNIFIKKSEKGEDEDKLAFYANAKETFRCSSYPRNNQFCLTHATLLDHIEHHMNQIM